MKNDLRVMREKRGITQDTLGRAVGVTRQTIISLESGRYNPSLALAFKLARYFSCPIETIFHDEEAEA
jgi:putative transcriptional regulator